MKNTKDTALGRERERERKTHLERSVQEVDPLRKLWRHMLQALLKELARAFDLGAPIPLDKLDEVDIPDLIHDGPLEQRDTTLVPGVVCVCVCVCVCVL